MPWGRKSRFFCWLDSARENQVRAAGDANSGITFTGGGWAGVVDVRIYAVGSENRVRICIRNHPNDEDQSHCVELYSGPLVASEVNLHKRKLRRRRSVRLAQEIVAERLLKSTAPPVHDESDGDSFFYHESE